MVGHGRGAPFQDENDECVIVTILSVRALAVPAVLSLVHARFPSSR